jgi:hypothetical protein
LKPLKYLAALLLMAAFGAAGFVGMAFVQFHGPDLQALHEVAHFWRAQRMMEAQRAAQQAQQPAPGEQAK